MPGRSLIINKYKLDLYLLVIVDHLKMAEFRSNRYERNPGRSDHRGERRDEGSAEKIPADVENFLRRLRASLLNEGGAGAKEHLEQLSELYEVELPALSETYFAAHNPKNPRAKKTLPWPTPASVKSILDHPQVEEVYQLHYARSHQNFLVKVIGRSWEYYGSAFSTFTAESGCVIDLPNAWIWDIIDEFIFHLGFSRNFRARPDPQQQQQHQVVAWSVAECLQRLETLVESSGIIKILGHVADGSEDPTHVIAPGPRHLRRVLGLAALVGIVRIRVQQGDYYGALMTAQPLMLSNARGLAISLKIPPLHSALYLNIGLSYLMFRRYADAVSMLQQVMNVRSQRKYFEGTQGPVVRLIIMAGVLGDFPAHDYSALVGDSYKVKDDDQVLIAQGDLDRCREIFLRGAPKFFSAADHSTGGDGGLETRSLQLKIFLRGVEQQTNVLKLRGYLMTYSTLTTQKAASLLKVTDDAVSADLVCMKRNTRQRARVDGDGIMNDVVKRVSTVDFIASNGTITVHKNINLPTLAAAFSDRLVALHKATHKMLVD